MSSIWTTADVYGQPPSIMAAEAALETEDLNLDQLAQNLSAPPFGLRNAVLGPMCVEVLVAARILRLNRRDGADADRYTPFHRAPSKAPDPLIPAVLQLDVFVLAFFPFFFVREMVSRLFARVAGIVT